MDILHLAFQITLICIAIHALFWEGMIYYRVGKSIEILLSAYKFTKKLHKPLFSCLICMSSFWTILFVCYFQGTLFDIDTTTFFVLMLEVCAMNVIADSLIYFLRNGK